MKYILLFASIFLVTEVTLGKSCIEEREKVGKSFLLGAFKPKCNDDGSYQQIQCHERHCFCVDKETGVQIDGSAMKDGIPKCHKISTKKRCMNQHVLSMRHSLLGSFRPRCNDDGTFQDIQCREGSCFCVNPTNGEEIYGTRVFGTKPKICDSPCIRERHQKSKFAMQFGLLGSGAPRCRKNGKYEKIQCFRGLCYPKAPKAH